MQQIRISATQDVIHALTFLKRMKYPVLTYPEIIRTVLSHEVISAKQHILQSDIPTTELVRSSAASFGVNDEEEVSYSQKDIKKPYVV